MTRDSKLIRYRKALSIAYDALQKYADPSFYHAIMIIPDRPTGGFDEDVSVVKNSEYDRPMPGKEARKALKLLERRYGSLELEPTVDDS